jgi:hypothetical protein
MNEVAAKALFDAEMPALLSLAKLRGWEVHSAAYPLVDVTFVSTERMPLRVQMHAPDWNDTPPSVALLLPSGDLCPSEKLPQHNMFNRSAHNVTGKPFICSPGTKEYHTHSSHLNDPWDNHRGKSRNNLPGILTQIWNAWQHAPKTP